MSKSILKRPVFQEDPIQQAAEQQRYFGGLGQPKAPGLSADDKYAHEKNLPSEEEGNKKLEYFSKGFEKTSRSGSFAKAGASAAIFPNGLKFASDFIDNEATPGRHKLPGKPDKVVPKQTRQVETPRAAVVIADRCMDCMEIVDPHDAHINLIFVTERESLKLNALGLKFGDPILDLICNKCQKEMDQYRYMSMPLVFKGSLFSPDEMKTIQKWSPQLGIHSGTQIRLGDWKKIKRIENIWNHTSGHIINHRLRGDDTIFRNDRKTRPDVHIERAAS
jgi:hypothetical protein